MARLLPFLAVKNVFPSFTTRDSRFAILACLREINRVLVPNGEIRVSGPKKDTDLDKLFSIIKEELIEVRAQGYAYSFEESVIGLGCVAAPVFDFAGAVAAALSITTDIERFERHLDEYRAVIVRTAKRVSKLLGHMVFKG